MTRSNKPLLIAVAAVFAVLIAASTYWLLFAEEPGQTAVVPDGSAKSDATAAPDAAPDLEMPRSESPLSEHAVAVDPSGSTLAWPVKLQLELVRAADLPRAEGVPPLGAGGTARLTGRIVDARELGVVAKITFLAGANKGRELTSNSEGSFGASDLYPGLSLVQIDGPGDLDAQREVRLRQGKESNLPLGFGMPGSVSGTVFDRAGAPIVAAEVQIDGQYTYTDLMGNYLLPNIASGIDVQLVVRKEGYAARSERIAVPVRGKREKMNYTLQPGCTLVVVVADRVGGPDDAEIVLWPDQLDRERTFPWHLVSPAKCPAGLSVTFKDLPAMRIAVRVFHQGSIAKPPAAVATLQESQPTSVVVHLEAAPSLVGTITGPDGQPVFGARVRLEAPDRVGAALTFLKEMPGMLEAEILPTLPVSMQETLSDRTGQFLLTSFPSASPTSYLIAESSNGEWRGARIVKQGDERADLRIGPVEAGEGSLAIEFPGRHQGVPVVVSIQGAPREEELVPLGKPLLLEGLAPGRWRIRGTWNARSLFAAPDYLEFDVGEASTLSVVLPQGAIDGQDEDTRLRAGRITGN